MLLPSSVHQWRTASLEESWWQCGLPGCFACLWWCWAYWYQVWLLIWFSAARDLRQQGIRGLSLPLVYISWHCFTWQSYPESREVNRDFSCIFLKCVVTPLSQRPSLPVLADPSVVSFERGLQPCGRTQQVLFHWLPWGADRMSLVCAACWTGPVFFNVFPECKIEFSRGKPGEEAWHRALLGQDPLRTPRTFSWEAFLSLRSFVFLVVHCFVCLEAFMLSALGEP